MNTCWFRITCRLVVANQKIAGFNRLKVSYGNNLDDTVNREVCYLI